MRRVAPLLALAALVLLLAGPGRAEVWRMEVVGAVPAGENAPAGMPVRRAALRQALAEAVAQVAMAQLEAHGRPSAPVEGEDAAPGEPAMPVTPEDWVEVLGGDAADYAVRYRVLEDRGERRALLVRNPDVTTEYVLLVEVHVDADRVTRGLRQAGLLAEAQAGGPRRTLRVVLTPLPSYAAVSALREHLDAAGETVATPERFQADQAVLRVETAASADAVLGRLLAEPPEGLRVRPVEVNDAELRLEIIEEPGAAALGD